MTQDYKKTLLDYITNLTPGAETTGEILQDINDVARNKWRDYIPSRWYDFNLAGILKSKTSDVIIFYGGYVESGGTYSNNSKGIIIITDNMLNPIQTIYQYDSGTVLRPITCMLQEEDGQFVAIDSYSLYSNVTESRAAYPSTEKRFIMLNDISISIENVYGIKLRRSYILGNDYKNFLCKDMYKNPNSSHYFMVGIKIDTSTEDYNPRYTKIIDLKINVGSANEWATAETTNKYLYGGSYCYFDNSDNAQWKVIISPNAFIDLTIRYWYGTNGTASGNSEIATFDYKTYVDATNYNNQCVFANENLAYFVLTNQRWGISGTLEAKYIGLYSYNFSTNALQELYFKSLGNYDFCYLEQINVNIVLGNLYIEYITNIDMNNDVGDFYVQRYEGEWSPLLVKETGNYRTRNCFYVSQDFNLLKMYCFNNWFASSGWNLIDITEIYSAFNYNGEFYENYNSLIGDYGNIYSNNKLVFSRDLYNLSVINNYSVSTLEIPNTYLNGITLSPKDLIGKTNTQLVSDTMGINKNIYEVLFLNFINTINVIDNEENVVTSSGRYINQNINVGTQINQKNTKCNKVFITWEDNSTKAFPISWTKTDDTHCYTEFTIYIEQPIESLEFMSNDMSTTYISLNTSNMETGKFYTIKQYLKVE
jgi:hypothetical protein